MRGYGGRLNIRPTFQREFIYKDKQRNEVIHTVRKGFSLNTMYWAMAGRGGTTEAWFDSTTPVAPLQAENSILT